MSWYIVCVSLWHVAGESSLPTGSVDAHLLVVGRAAAYVISFEDGEPQTTPLKLPGDLESFDASRFYYAPTGKCLYRMNDARWWAGDVLNPVLWREVKTEIPPLDPLSVAVANGGDKAAWTVPREGDVTVIMRAGFSPAETCVLAEVDGYCCAPAWSPDDTKLAFYRLRGAQDRSAGYALAVLDLGQTDPLLSEAAPPSLPLRWSRVRDIPPRWSASGEWLLFEGRYGETPWHSMSLVPVRGGAAPRPAPDSATWSVDGGRLFGLRFGEKESGKRSEAIPIEMQRPTGETFDLGGPIEPPPESKCAWDARGERLAYANGNAVWIHERKHQKNMQVAGLSLKILKLDWIEVRRGVGEPVQMKM